MDSAALRQMMEDFVPFNKFLGIKVVGLDKETVHLELAFRPEFIGDPLRPALHGGVISTLADVAGGMAVWASVADARARVSTIDLRVDYLRPGRAEKLEADAHLVRKGNRVGVVDVRLFHASHPEEAVATGKGVYNIVVAKEK